MTAVVKLGAREGDMAQQRRRPGHPGGRTRDDGLRGTIVGLPRDRTGLRPSRPACTPPRRSPELVRKVDRPGGSGPPGRLSAAGNQGGEMAAIVTRDNAKATWLTGQASVRAKACDMIQRAMARAAATILICAAAAALVQLAAELLSFPAPIAVTAMTLMAAALLDSLRRHLRTAARHRSGPGEPAWPGAIGPPASDRAPDRARPRRQPVPAAQAADGHARIAGRPAAAAHHARSTGPGQRPRPAAPFRRAPGQSPANGSTARQTVPLPAYTPARHAPPGHRISGELAKIGHRDQLPPASPGPKRQRRRITTRRAGAGA